MVDLDCMGLDFMDLDFTGSDSLEENPNSTNSTS